MTIVVDVENLGKRYFLGQAQERPNTFRDAIHLGVRSFGRRLVYSFAPPSNPMDTQEFWALKDVSFQIAQGERVGIVGRNGAGKSTLLKILSRITEPTAGKIHIRGRVASLLEVGTGFHPELTGRENIYLNGAILGMSKAETRRKFDEIVAFAEVEKFLDTPVKRYSSGMYVRLAFAVAAHLEPEILIVDEVLAVGDAQFQKKCLGKMQDVGKEGRTVIFVSHNMSAIESLCDRGILLDSGAVAVNGMAEEAIRAYLSQAEDTIASRPLAERTDRSGSRRARFTNFRVLEANGMECLALRSGEDYCFELDYLNTTGSSLSNCVVSLDVFDEKNTRVMMFRSNFTNSQLDLNEETGKIRCQIRNLPLAIGTYRVSLFLSHADQETLDYIEDAASFAVGGGDFFGTGSAGLPTHCKILARAQWSTHHPLDQRQPAC